jgi:catecholate siderophore receptor
MTGTGARRFALLATTFLISFNVNLVEAVAREKPKQKQQAAEALDANAQAVQLDTINVESENAGQTGYVATRTSTATKTDTRLRDVPQSVSVVTEELIKDTSAQSMADVVRYVPGVSPQQGEGNRDQISIRGQSTTADFFADGIRDDAQYFRDTYNSSRVEVLKGPNAMIFGRGGGGGVVNRVMKEADGVPVRELMLQGGSFSNKRVTGDVGGKVNDNLAVRFNGVYENSDSYRDFVNIERYGFNPTLTYRPSDSTKVKLSYEYFHDDRTTDRGVPSFQGRPLPTPPSTFFGNPDLSTAYVNAHVLTAALDHRFDSGVQVNSQTRYADYAKFYQNVFPGAVNAAGTLATISAYNNQSDRNNLFNQTDWTYTAMTGPVKHKLLFGTEFGRQQSDSFRNSGFFNNATTNIQVPVGNPVTYTPVTFRQSATDANARSVAHVSAAYLQDQIELTRWLQVIGGVRFERFDLDYHNNRNGQQLNRVDDLVSPRVGVVLKPIEPLSFYASYSVSYLPGSGDQFSALSTSNDDLKPEKFTNREIGVKWDIHPGLALTAAVFQLDRENTTANDPNNPGIVVQTGSSRAEGFEIGLNGYVTKAWQVAAGYGYQDVRYTSNTTNAVRGARVPHVPQNTFSLWNRYDFTEAWGAGVGVIHQTDFYAGTDNLVSIPGFTRVDAALFWTLNKHVRAQINVENVFDTRYYAFAHSNNNITPGSPRAVRVALTARY